MAKPEPPPDLDAILAAFDRVPHCRELGMTVVEVEPRRGIVRLEYQERLVGNPETGHLHGGAVTALLDTACGMVAMASVPPGVSVATLDLRIDYLKPAEPGRPLFAFAECYRRTASVAFIRGGAYHESPGSAVANCVGTFMLGGTGYAAADAPETPIC